MECPRRVQFEDPAGHVIQEVTVVGDRHHGAFEVVQEAFQPGHGLGVQVVGRFVQQQHVRLFEQQAAQRYAAALTPDRWAILASQSGRRSASAARSSWALRL